MTNASRLTRRLAQLLARTKTKVVFAESCTAGLVSALLGRIAGISEFHCGSAVTYRNATKQQWLHVSAASLEHPGPVSGLVAREMASGVLLNTPEADWSASITGHLGPNAPPDLDGLVYVGIARRVAEAPQASGVSATDSRHQLTSTTRLTRQREAAVLVLSELYEALAAAMLADGVSSSHD